MKNDGGGENRVYPLPDLWEFHITVIKAPDAQPQSR